MVMETKNGRKTLLICLKLAAALHSKKYRRYFSRNVKLTLLRLALLRRYKDRGPTTAPVYSMWAANNKKKYNTICRNTDSCFDLAVFDVSECCQVYSRDKVWSEPSLAITACFITHWR